MTVYLPTTPWPLRWTCDVSSESPVVTGWAAQAATEVLWSLTGLRFGTREVALRPCRRACYGAAWPAGWYEWAGVGPALPAGWYGAWFEAGCGSCLGSGDTCACARLQEVRLPTPVSAVTEVRVDGVVLVTGAYRLYDDQRLLRVDGGEWPRCNNLAADASQPGTWQVTATYGEQVPESGRFAAGELACEFLKALRGEDCRLPRNVSQLARQGVTITFPDVSALFKEGRTGLWAVDLFISSVNPTGQRGASRVYRVDGPAHRRPS